MTGRSIASSTRSRAGASAGPSARSLQISVRVRAFARRGVCHLAGPCGQIALRREAEKRKRAGEKLWNGVACESPVFAFFVRRSFSFALHQLKQFHGRIFVSK